MAMLTELTNYVVAQSTRYTVGASSTAIPIWKNKFPADSNNTAIAFFESGGPGPLYTHTGVLAIERPTIQVISRSTSYATARDNAEHIYTILSSVTNVAIAKTTSTGTTTYLTVTPIQSPSDMGQDAEERAMVTCNFMTEKELS